MTAAPAKPAFKPTEVAKVIEPLIDEANLLIVDRDPEEDKTTVPSSDALLSRARDNVQYLFNRIWQLKRVIVKDAVCAELPEKEIYRLPREKPIPAERQLTRWEQFAKEKGIQKKKTPKKVYDEATDEWKPTYGYRRANDDTKDWLIEIKDNQDPNKDYFAERVQQKKERVAKNKYQQMKNEERVMKANGKNIDGDDVPIGVGGRTELASKDQLTYQIHKTKVSTASAGKFEPTMKGEKKPKLGIKRKFDSNEHSVKDEKEKQLKILSSMNAKKPKILQSRIAASEQAIQKAVAAETGENSSTRREKKKPKGRSQSSIHRQQHYQAVKKGKAPPPKKGGKNTKRPGKK